MDEYMNGYMVGTWMDEAGQAQIGHGGFYTQVSDVGAHVWQSSKGPGKLS